MKILKEYKDSGYFDKNDWNSYSILPIPESEWLTEPELYRVGRNGVEYYTVLTKCKKCNGSGIDFGTHRCSDCAGKGKKLAGWKVKPEEMLNKEKEKKELKLTLNSNPELINQENIKFIQQKGFNKDGIGYVILDIRKAIAKGKTLIAEGGDLNSNLHTFICPKTYPDLPHYIEINAYEYFEPIKSGKFVDGATHVKFGVIDNLLKRIEKETPENEKIKFGDKINVTLKPNTLRRFEKNSANLDRVEYIVYDAIGEDGINYVWVSDKYLPFNLKEIRGTVKFIGQIIKNIRPGEDPYTRFGVELTNWSVK